MKKPLVTIITPTLNAEEFLEKTILSIISQTYSNVEYIIVDGCSTDKTQDIINKYRESISCVITKRDGSMYSAINRGIYESTGEIVAYLNADDLYFNDTIETIVNIFDTRPDVDLIYGSEQVINDKGECMYKYRFPKYCWPMFVSANFSTIGQPCSFWRRDVHNHVGYFDESMRMAADFDFYCKAGKNLSMLKVGKVLGMYRVHDHSLTSNNSEDSISDINKIHDRYITNPLLNLLRPFLGALQQLLFRLINTKAILIKLIERL